jgi:hypothetical protein
MAVLTRIERILLLCVFFFFFFFHNPCQPPFLIVQQLLMDMVSGAESSAVRKELRLLDGSDKTTKLFTWGRVQCNGGASIDHRSGFLHFNGGLIVGTEAASDRQLFTHD